MHKQASSTKDPGIHSVVYMCSTFNILSICPYSERPIICHPLSTMSPDSCREISWQPASFLLLLGYQEFIACFILVFDIIVLQDCTANAMQTSVAYLARSYDVTCMNSVLIILDSHPSPFASGTLLSRPTRRRVGFSRTFITTATS
jgi:hypothetical protein